MTLINVAMWGPQNQALSQSERCVLAPVCVEVVFHPRLNALPSLWDACYQTINLNSAWFRLSRRTVKEVTEGLVGPTRHTNTYRVGSQYTIPTLWPHVTLLYGKKEPAGLDMSFGPKYLLCLDSFWELHLKADASNGQRGKNRCKMLVKGPNTTR